MKIGGVEVSSNEEYLVLPRPNGNDIVIKAVAVNSDDEFMRLCPEPKAKAVLKAGGWQKQFDDPAYLEAVGKWGELRFAFMMLKSIEPSEIEWETVKMDQPSTWLNWQDELIAAGLSMTEVNRIINTVSSANSLNEAKLAEARENFLRGRVRESERSSGQDTAPESSQSGEPASELESDPQE